jgi:FkbM family methyltransferase
VSISKAQASALTGVYSLARKSGLLSTYLGRALFTYSYGVYKRYLEDPFYPLACRRPALFRHGHVLDIGANIGYTSSVFARAIDPEFRVYAFEPEPFNFSLLQRSAASRRLRGRVVPVRCAVGAENGTVTLLRNDDHHGDHRVLTTALGETSRSQTNVIQVPLVSIDSFVQQTIDGQSVSFIKIDVQGYELPVCSGLTRTMAQNPNAVIALEYAPNTLEELGFAPDDLLAWIRKTGYAIYSLDKSGRLTKGLPSKDTKTEYADLLLSGNPLSID